MIPPGEASPPAARGEPPLHLPSRYLGGFAAPAIPGEDGRRIWAFRAAIGEWRRWPIERTPGGDRHFNDADPAVLGRLAPLWEELAALAPSVAPLLGDGLAAERGLGPEDRAALARFLALIGVRNTKGAGDLSLDEARAGVESLADALQEMGWVLWVADPPDYFIGSSSPFHAAFPKGDESQTTGFGITAPQVEISFALGPRVALHATWRRKGALWRRAREEVVLEINGRTCAGARQFLFSPQPAVPG
jgi:hypothetical protein